MNTLLWNTFLTYTNTGSLRKTGDLLKISHVSVMRNLKLLEDEVGFPLFIRMGKSLQLTESGQKLIIPAQNFLDQYQQLLKSIRNEGHAKPINICRISTFEVFSTHFFPDIIQLIGPQVKLELLEEIPGEIEKSVQSGKADIGITYLPVPTQEVEHLKIKVITSGIYKGRASQFKHDDKFAELPFIVPIQKDFITPSRTKGLDGWPDDRIPRNIFYKVKLLESALTLTSLGFGVGYFPNFVIERYNRYRLPQFQLIALEHSHKIISEQEVFLIKRKHEEESLVFKKLAKLIRSLQ